MRVLINAGGAGTRMGGDRPKPLVPVAGLPLVERNLLAALGAGAREVLLVVPAQAPELSRWAEVRARALVTAVGAALRVVPEPSPRGTGACLAMARGSEAPVLMLYADNLTGLDLRAFARHHEVSGGDTTVAVHEEPFTVPFGRVRCEGGRLLAYEEKPSLPVTVASGAYLFSARALEAIPPEGRFDVPELIRARLADGHEVGVFAHAAPWVDVNDPAARARAERLVAVRPALERFAPPEAPVVEVCGAVLTQGEDVLLEWRPPAAALYPGVWDTPGGKLEAGETPAQCVARELWEELGLHGLALRPVVTLDDLEPGRGWIRHHVFAAELGQCAPFKARERQVLAWHRRADPTETWASPALRSVAHARFGEASE